MWLGSKFAEENLRHCQQRSPPVFCLLIPTASTHSIREIQATRSSAGAACAGNCRNISPRWGWEILTVGFYKQRAPTELMGGGPNLNSMAVGYQAVPPGNQPGGKASSLGVALMAYLQKFVAKGF